LKWATETKKNIEQKNKYSQTSPLEISEEILPYRSLDQFFLFLSVLFLYEHRKTYEQLIVYDLT
jgi:hypothetical protein